MYGKVLRNLRQKKGVSQKDFARQLGIAQSTYALYELEKREPSFELLYKLTDYFHVSYDYLFTGVECDQKDVQEVTSLSGEALKQLSSMKNDRAALNLISAFIAWAGKDAESFNCLTLDYQRITILGMILALSSEPHEKGAYLNKLFTDDELQYYIMNGLIDQCLLMLKVFLLDEINKPVIAAADKLEFIIQNHDHTNGGATNGTPKEAE